MLIYSEIKQPWHTMYCQILFGRFFEWRPSTNSIHAYTRNGIMPSKPVAPIVRTECKTTSNGSIFIKGKQNFHELRKLCVLRNQRVIDLNYLFDIKLIEFCIKICVNLCYFNICVICVPFSSRFKR